MLEEINMSKLPYEKRVSEFGVEPIIEYKHFACTEYFEKINPREIMICDNIIQVAAVIINRESTDLTINIPLPVIKSLSATSVLSLPSIRMLPNVFKTVFISVGGHDTFNIQITGLQPNAKKALMELYEEGKIDRATSKILSGNSNVSEILQSGENISFKAFELRDNSQKAEESKMLEFILGNKFIMYLLSGCEKNNGIYGIALGNLTIEEIEKNEEINALLNVFEKVYFTGIILPSGKWISTNLKVTRQQENIALNKFENWRVSISK